MDTKNSRKLNGFTLGCAMTLALASTSAFAQNTTSTTQSTSGSQSTQGTSGSQSTQGTSGSQSTQGTSGTSGSQSTQGASGSQTMQSTGGSQTSNTSATQTTSGNTTQSPRSLPDNQKAKIRGIVTQRAADTFTIRDENGIETVVRLSDQTRVTERKSNPFRRAKNYGVTNILRGLNLEVEGRGDAAGQLVADRVRFSDEELKVARTVESRVDPVENRVGTAEGRIGTAENRIGQVEQNSQRLSGQLEELAAVSNAARGGAKAAQDTADAAIAGVRSTNERISALDDFSVQQSTAVNFKVGSSVLTPEYKTQLDEIAKQALAAKGYVIEVAGHADATGGTDLNRRLSQKRADSVVRYLVETHNIPLRRIITPFGYGEAQSIADNKTREGRAANRRVEVKVLVNNGLMQAAPGMPSTSSSSSPAPNQTPN